MSVLNATIRERLSNAMNLRRGDIIQMLKKLKSDKFTTRDYDCPFVRWEDCERHFGSCWGSEIADLAAFVCQEGVFVFVKDGKPVAIEDTLLSQEIKRVKTMVDEGVTVHTIVEANPRHDGVPRSLMEKVQYPINAYVVNTNEGLLVFDYSGKGTVNAFTWVTQWVVDDPGLQFNGMTPEIEAACEKANETRKSIQVMQWEGKLASLLAVSCPDPDIVTVVDLVNGNVTIATKKKTLTLCNHDCDNNTNVSIVSVELFKCYKIMCERKHTTNVFRSPNGHTCVIVPLITGQGIAKFYCLNFGSNGVHLTAEYNEGFAMPVFAIRSENMNETVVKVPLHKFKVVMATATGNDPKMIMLYDMLKGVGAYGKHAGLSEDVDLALDKDKEEWFTLRLQAYICPGGDKIELFERLYSYSSTDEKPTTLVSYHTGFGTSFYTPTTKPLKIQPTKYDELSGELSAFNLSVKPSDKTVGDMATYKKEENEKNISDGCSMAVPMGPLGFPKLANATILCQWPVQVTPPPDSRGGLFTLEEYDGEVPRYRSLGAGLAEGSLMASKTGFGSYQGKSSGVAVGDLKRRVSAGTGTFSIIFSVEPKSDGHRNNLLPGEYTVSEDDLKSVVKMLDDLHELAGTAVRIFDDDAHVCVDAPGVPNMASSQVMGEPPVKKHRVDVGIISPPTITEVAM